MTARKTYILKLYVAGNTPNSMRALKTLREILRFSMKPYRELMHGLETVPSKMARFIIIQIMISMIKHC